MLKFGTPILFFALVFALVFSVTAQSADLNLDELIIQAKSEAVRTTTAVTVLSQTDLANKKSQTLADVLRNVVGVNVARSGGAGQPSSVFIRGAKSEHTLVLIDGIEANDPTTTTRFFDFSSLTVENIDRIEVYRGARSTRFGSDAMGGVINVITKKGDGEPLSNLSVEAGTYDTRTLAASIAGSQGPFRYSAGASHLSSAGFSAADAGDGDEPDSLVRSSLSSRLDWDFSNESDLSATVRVIDASTKLDSGGGPAGDDPNYDSKSRQILSGLMYRTKALSPALQSSIGGYFNSTYRRYDNDPNVGSTTNYHETFQSESLKLETDHRLKLTDSSHFAAALQYRKETAMSHEQGALGESLIYDFVSSGVDFEIGVRHDQISTTAESILNTSASLVYQFARSTSLQMNFGTGFKNPSLFQLYSNFGSQSLRSEHATTWDVSVETELTKAAVLSLGYFENQYRDLIDFDLVASKYSNISNAKSNGLELQLLTLPVNGLVVRAGAKTMRTRDDVTGLELLRRPRISYSASAEFQSSRWATTVTYEWVGDRDDIDPTTFTRTRVEGYDVLGFGVRCAISKTWATHIRIENAADRTYADIAGYRTARRNFSAGLTASF